jgi:hypothetical protein
MKRLQILTLGLALFLGVGMFAAPTSAQTPDQLSGQVVAEIDPFLILRTLARYDPEGFLDLLETILPELLSEVSQVEIGAITVDLSLLGR